MQSVAHGGRQTLALLLLLLAVTAPTAIAQGRSKIRVVEVINGNIDNITMNLEMLRDFVSSTTTPTPLTTTTVSSNDTDTNETSVERRDLFPLHEETDDDTWVVHGIAAPEVVTVDCGGNTNCIMLDSALNIVDTVVAEVNDDNIYDGQADQMYKADADMVTVRLNSATDKDFFMMLHDNIDYLDTQMLKLQEDKDAIQSRYDKMKSTETLGIVLGLVAILLAFIALTTGGYKCYQKTRKDDGVPEGLIMENPF